LIQTSPEQAFEGFRITPLPVLRGHGQCFKLLLENLQQLV
jgi:hypothetical protein